MLNKDGDTEELPVRNAKSLSLNILGRRIFPSSLAFLMLANVATAEPPVAVAKGGVLAFEAEDFFEQTKTEVRKWHRFDKESQTEVSPDPDPPHLERASGGAYLEILPDTRANHDQKLIKGENFSNKPGKLAILRYRVRFDKPGRYHVWARVFSTGTEDNGFHIGLDGQWPESGQRWQTTVKKRWHWESRQRTEKVHGGVRGLLFLDVEKAGDHVIEISMREDGLELDRLLLTLDPEFVPGGVDGSEAVKPEPAK